jgi:16S rRNA (guanine527-N7)-methyltransferase
MNQEQQAILDACAVSHETIHRLTRYQEMLISWNEKFNLVSASTIPQIWTRHFLDSAQLMKFIPEKAETLADMGSGAGFPGLVLALLAEDKKRPLCIHAVEGTGKKADFLRAVIADLGLTAIVRQERIEEIKDLKADIVTARALKPLPDLLKYASRLMKKDGEGLFLKGKSANEELTQAKKYWIFSAKIYPSLSDDSGRVLVVKNLQYKTKR